MSYEDMVSKIAEDTGLPRGKVKDVIESLGSATISGLKTSGRVRIPALGVFEMRMRAARTGRNPQTGETLDIAARQRVGFKMGARLKGAIS